MNAALERLLLLKGREQLPQVLIAAAECAPLSKTGGLADVVGALPKALAALGFDARVITPYHRCIKEKYAGEVRHLCYFYVDLGWRHQYVGLEELDLPDLTVYLIDSEYYFGDRIYRGGAAEVEQYAYFQRAVLEAIPRLPDFRPEVLHCNDWHTAMLPFLLRTQPQGEPCAALRTVLTIHNIAFQGWAGLAETADLLGVEPRWLSYDGVKHGDVANFLKAGCLFADRVNTVSPSYAEEIRTPEFGAGLEEVLRSRGADVSGILNGLDASYDPASDPDIACRYDADRPAGKRRNKQALLRELGLEGVSADTPLIAMVTRMTAQKGFDLVLQGLESLMEQGVGFVLLGSGEPGYENAIRAMAQRWPGRMHAHIGYDEALARRIYAGADFLLMPSAFEPCGLSQMIAMRYGTLPIVHEVGGLRDTVRPYNRFTGEGNGFSFYDYNCGTMLGTCAFALATYADKRAMRGLIRSAMTADWSFAASAVEYGRLYLSVLPPAGVDFAHDPAQEFYRSPFGAVTCGTTVRIRMRAVDFVEQASLVANGEVLPMARDAEGVFSVDYTAPAEPVLVRYKFRIGDDVEFGMNGVGCGGVRPWNLTVYAPEFRTPDWAAGAFIYQIFPDRFAPGGDSFAKGVEYHRALGRNIEVHESWDEPVKYHPTTREYYYPDDFYGGTLEGIREKLPELRALGVRCLYLNPIFESASNHRYDTADYRKIDPMLGTEEDFTALCAAAAALGMHVVLDGVFSHTGDDSVYFNRAGRYPGPGAWQGEESPYYGWYDFRRFPDDYRCWWGFQNLPEVRESDPDWQKFIVTGEDSVIRRWLRKGAGGWRLDVADELPDGIIDMMRAAVKETDPDALLIGEVWEDATTKISYGARRSYALGRALDSVMNYPFRVAMLDFALGQIDAAALRDFLVGQKLSYPAPMYRCLMNLLDSHDTARVRSVLGAGSDGSDYTRALQAEFRLTPEQNARGAALQRLCAAVQFAIPGMPCVYYGDEEGMEGLRDPFCRAPYEKGDGDLRAWYAKLAAARNGSEALLRGDAAFAAYGADTLCILRYGAEEAVLVAVCRGGAPAELHPALADFRGLSAADAARIGALPALTVPACGSAMRTLVFRDRT